MRPTKSRSGFTRFAKWTAHATGRPLTFFMAVGVIAVWAVTGPLFGFSDTWQLVINTGTTIVTFLMVFLIQNTQNRDAEATQVKLDEIMRAIGEAQNELLDLEELEEEDLDRIRETYVALARKARQERHAKRTTSGLRSYVVSAQRARRLATHRPGFRTGLSGRFIRPISPAEIPGRWRTKDTSSHACLSPAGSGIPVPKAGMPVKRTPFWMM